jgi:hypothetical protein
LALAEQHLSDIYCGPNHHYWISHAAGLDQSDHQSATVLVVAELIQRTNKWSIRFEVWLPYEPGMANSLAWATVDELANAAPTYDGNR